MRAIVYRRYGGPGVLQLEEVERPTPNDLEVLVRVRATTATKFDCWCRSSTAPPGMWLLSRIASGLMKPKKQVLGTELAGEVEAAGAKVTRFKAGDSVYGFSEAYGAYAEYVCLPENAVAKKPSNMTYAEAAAVPYGGLTALYFLRKASIKEGQKVIIFGASGSLGGYAVQLAKSFGAEVSGVCSTAKIEYVQSLGADQVIDYTKEDFTSSGKTYDVIFDTVGKSSVRGSLRSLEEGGHYLLATFGLSKLIQILWFSRQSTKKVIMGLLEVQAEDLIYLKELIEAGKLRSIIDRSYPLEQAAEAHRYVESGRKAGNVVLTVAPSAFTI